MSPFDLFTPPDIQTEPPVAPGSETSHRAAKLVTNPVRARSHRLIMIALAAHGPLTREQLSDRTGLKESTICGRLFELRPMFVEQIEGGGKSSSGVSVDQYDLTEIGHRRFRQASEPWTP